jgi:hypothetical protein
VPAGVREALAGFPDRYNIAIRGPAAVIFIQDQRWKVASMSWGLVPSWEKEPSTRYSTQTARLERAARSRLYRSSWASRRCVLPLNGYYKWDHDSNPRQPWFIQAADGAVLFAAALWSLWGEVDTGLLSFSVLTHEHPGIPSPLVAGWSALRAAGAACRLDPGRAELAARWLLRQAQPELEAYPSRGAWPTASSTTTRCWSRWRRPKPSRRASKPAATKTSTRISTRANELRYSCV